MIYQRLWEVKIIKIRDNREIPEFTQDDVKQIKNMLNDRYWNCKVIIVNNYFGLIPLVIRELYGRATLKSIHELVTGYLKKQFKGVYSSKSKVAYIFTSHIYDELDDDIKKHAKLFYAVVVFHELRHYFQHEYMKISHWEEADFEKDARKFEMKMFMKHIDDFN